MAKLKDALLINTSIPAAFEAKFKMLPKLSRGMASIAKNIPDGPDLPAALFKIITPPAPNAAGQPLSGFFKGPPTETAVPMAARVSLTEYTTDPNPAGNVTQNIIERRGF